MPSAVVPSAIVFGSLAWFGVVLAARVCRDLPRLPESPEPGRVPVVALCAGAAIVGAMLAWHGLAPLQLLLLGGMCMALVAAWSSDVTNGIVPDVFTVVPLAAIVAFAIATQSWWLIVSAAVPLLPFGLAALVSKGRGMGWGDVKLVALGGALLGMNVAVAAFALACLAAVIAYRLHGVKAGPIAFAPYLVAAIGISLAVVG